MKEKIEKLKELIDDSSNIVFLGGAGVSTESGIPDFRSEKGLFNQGYKYPAEIMLSHSFFIENMEEFYDFYKEKMNVLNYEPNITHFKLANLEKKGKLKAVITQNIDGLHQKAGSVNVLELHGSVYRNYCVKCKKTYSAEKVFGAEGIPKCECGGYIRPDVVLYEEGLNKYVLKSSINAIQKADLMIIGGTSLEVYPANSLLNYFIGENIVLINKQSTPYDSYAKLVINESLGDIFKAI